MMKREQVEEGTAGERALNQARKCIIGSIRLQGTRQRAAPISDNELGSDAAS